MLAVAGWILPTDARNLYPLNGGGARRFILRLHKAASRGAATPSGHSSNRAFNENFDSPDRSFKRVLKKTGWLSQPGNSRTRPGGGGLFGGDRVWLRNVSVRHEFMCITNERALDAQRCRLIDREVARIAGDPLWTVGLVEQGRALRREVGGCELGRASRVPRLSTATPSRCLRNGNERIDPPASRGDEAGCDQR